MPRNPSCDTGEMDTPPPGDLVELFARSTATLVFDDGPSWPAADLAASAPAVSRWLGERGVSPGDRVAIRMGNGADYVRALLGCADSGVVAVSVNTRYSSDEVIDLVVRSGAVLTIESGDLPPASTSSGDRSRPGRIDDPFVVLTTSGTTSKPKMVLHHQRSHVEHALDVAAAAGYRNDDVVMVAMPLCGTFGLSSLLAAIAGDTRTIVTDYDTARAAASIEHERVTCLNGSDDMFHRLLEHGTDLSSIRFGGHARFNTSLDGIVERSEAAGAQLVGLYGMSEVQALFAMRSPRGEIAERERSGGRLSSPRAEYRIVDGELQLRGPSLFAGYLAEGGAAVDTELTARHVVDGWFRTGDLATADDDRSFEYVTRMSDVLRLGGFLVSPTEIEGVLTEVDGVAAAQVVAVDRPQGTRPVAFVIADEGVTVDEQAAIATCRDRLAIYKVPIRVITVAEFPTTPSANGTKIQKTRLRDLALAALG